MLPDGAIALSAIGCSPIISRRTVVTSCAAIANAANCGEGIAASSSSSSSSGRPQLHASLEVVEAVVRELRPDHLQYVCWCDWCGCGCVRERWGDTGPASIHQGPEDLGHSGGSYRRDCGGAGANAFAGASADTSMAGADCCDQWPLASKHAPLCAVLAPPVCAAPNPHSEDTTIHEQWAPSENEATLRVISTLGHCMHNSQQLWFACW